MNSLGRPVHSSRLSGRVARRGNDVRCPHWFRFLHGAIARMMSDSD